MVFLSTMSPALASLLTSCPCPVPGEPRDVAAKPFNSSTVIVDWRAPADDKQNGVIRAYQIYIQPKNTVREDHNLSTSLLYCFFLCAFLLILCVQEGVHQYYSQPLRFNTGNPEVTSYNVTGLQPDTKYKIQVEIVVEMKLHTTHIVL